MKEKHSKCIVDSETQSWMDSFTYVPTPGGNVMVTNDPSYSPSHGIIKSRYLTQFGNLLFDEMYTLDSRHIELNNHYTPGNYSAFKVYLDMILEGMDGI